MRKSHIVYSLYTALFTLLLTSCSEYEQVLKSKDMEFKYKKANEYYAKGKYQKANTLYQEALQHNRTNTDYEETYFRYATSFYELGDYASASLYFNTFATSFPRSDHHEDALYLAAKCYDKNSPRYVLDQTDTKRAIDAYQNFLLNYPNTDHKTEVDSSLARLRSKLERKDYESAKLYLKIEQYKAAAVSFNELVKKYPNSPNIEKYKLESIESLTKYADKSKENKQAERYNDALEEIDVFMYNYRDSEYIPEVEDMKEEIQSKINLIQS